MKKISKTAFLAISTILLFYGCKKDQNKSTAGTLPVQTVTSSSIPNGMVMTPQGLMSKASVHLIENGYHLELRGDHMLKIKTTTGEIKEDFGAIKIAAPAQTPILSGSTTTESASVLKGIDRSLTNAPGFPGWMTYSQLGQAGTEMNTINTTWIAPVAPTNQTTQLIYIGNAFSSLQYASGSTPTIIETILQWGSNGAIGYNNCWIASNWCTWSNGAAYSTPTASGAIVAGTTSMNGIITLNGTQADGSYNYTAQFNGISNPLTVIEGNTSNVPAKAIPLIPLQPYAYEILEAYCPSCTLIASDYPYQSFVQMNSNNVTTGLPGIATSLTWSGTLNGTTNAKLGEHTIVKNSLASGGVIQLWFRNASCSISYPSGPGTGGSYNFSSCSAPLSICPNVACSSATYTMSPSGTGYATINSSTGCITGSPTISATYTVTATNDGIPATSTYQVTINVQPAPTISYPTSEIFTQGTTITPIYPTVTGLAPTSYTISPSLNSNTGLIFNPANGEISGPPTKTSGPILYTITGTNGTCTTTSTITISVEVAITFNVSSAIGSTLMNQVVFLIDGVPYNEVLNFTSSYTNTIVTGPTVPDASATVVLQFRNLPMVTSGTLNGTYGTVSGNSITFTGINLSSTKTVNLSLTYP